jgi:hypothetical protein
VHRAGDGIAEDLLLRDADGDQVPDPRERMIGAILGEPDPQVADEPLDVEGEEARGEGENEEEDEIPCGHQLALRTVTAHRSARASGSYPGAATPTRTRIARGEQRPALVSAPVRGRLR